MEDFPSFPEPLRTSRRLRRTGAAGLWDLALTCAISLLGVSATFGAWSTGPWPAVASLALFAGLLLVRRRLGSILHATDHEARQLDAILGGVGDAVFGSAPDGAPLYYNRSFERLVRARPDSLDQPRLEHFVRPNERGRLAAQLSEAAETRHGAYHDEEYCGVRCDGSPFPLLCRVSAANLDSERIGLVATLRDATNDRVIQRGLQAVAQRLEFFFFNMPLGAVIWDRDFAVQEWNDSACRIFGWSAEQAFGRSYRELLAEEDDDAVESAVQSLEAETGVSHQRCRNRTRDGRIIETEWFHTSLADEDGNVVAVASMVVDLTQKLALERRLRQSQKLEALGVWTAGIAHEFNNLLTAILGNLELLALHAGLSGDPAEWLADAQAATGRARALTADLTRSHPSKPPRLQPMALGPRLRELADLFSYSLDGGLRFEVETPEDLAPTLGDAGQLDRAVEHLLQNAKNAEPSRITLSASNVVLDEAFCAEREWARPGAYVRIEVADDGVGIDPAVRSRIFEPFFTTQPVGRGSGLGLAVVRGVAKNHGGGIEIHSEPGLGTRASLYLRQAQSK